MRNRTLLHDPVQCTAGERAALQAETVQGAFDRLARIAAAALHAPIAFVSRVCAESQVFVGCVGLPQPLATTRELPLSDTICQYPIASGERFIVADARVHPLVHDNPAITAMGVIAYAGIPLMATNGRALGSLAVIDHQPREWTAAEIALLTDLAGDVMTEIALRETVAEREDALAAARAAQAEARKQDALARAFVEYGHDFITVVDAEGIYRYASPSHQRILGVSPDQLIGRQSLDDVPPQDRAAVAAWYADALAAPNIPHTRETVVNTVDGIPRTFESTMINRLADPDIGGIIITSRDVTERHATLAALRESERRLQTTIANAPVVLIAIDTEGTFTFAAGQGLEAVGMRPEDLVGRNSFAVYHEMPQLVEQMRRALNGERAMVLVEMRGLMIQIRYLPLTDDAGRVTGAIGVGTDVTERVRAEDALRHQAVHDGLTGLPNRILLRDRMEQALRIRERDDTALALLLIDLNGFKTVNDSAGHGEGDLLLRHVASVLHRVMRPTDTVARLGGDEFAVLLPDTDVATAVALVETFATVLHAPVALNGLTVRTTASVGIALAPAHGNDVSTLLRHADIAMYAAKRGRLGHCLYTGTEDEEAADRLALIADLHHALRTQTLTLVYQPIITCADDRLRAVEALVRWSHPTRGPIPPDVFIPLAEESGLITALSAWVLSEAIRQCGAWRAAGIAADMAVNLSMWDLQDATLVARVSALLDHHGVPPSALHLEVTESTVMREVARTVAVLARLAESGIAAAIDDFGTGYSSFAYLRQLPAKTLKIDKMFIRELGHETADAAIVRATIEMAHSLGMRVVAEGVEDAATLAVLRAMGCDLAQGYFISKPVPVADFTRWVQTWPPTPESSPSASGH